MSLSKTIIININMLYDLCQNKHFLQLKQIIPIIKDYKQRKIRNINSALNNITKINFSNDDYIKFNKKLFNIDKSIILKRYIQKIRNKINSKITNLNLTFDKCLEEFIVNNYKSHKLINITNMCDTKIKNYKKKN